MGRAADQDGIEGIAVDVGVVGQHVAGDRRVLGGRRRIVHCATGASLTAPTLIETVATLLSAWPSLAL